MVADYVAKMLCSSVPGVKPRCLWLFLLAFLVGTATAKDPVHILYLTDCTKYSDWQAVGMDFSFRNSGQKGHMTRVMCCTDEQKAVYNHDMLNLMPSHVAPSFAYNEKTKDHYPAFNKPGAVLDFMTKGEPMADYMLVIDSDMQLRHPFKPNVYNMTPGKAISADYKYMVGCTNDLATRHIPDIPLRNDVLAGPFKRHCDMVGGYTFMHRDDLSKIAPLWLSVTVDVRQDPEAWRLSGDAYVEKGGKPWISEMYGYSFACAKCDVWHKWDTKVMHYPTYEPKGIPKLLHYGLLFDVESYKFDKHWHYDLDISSCPPWNLSDAKKRTGGLFAHPPDPAVLISKDGPPLPFYKDLLAIETVATLNAGFCDYHLKHCPPSQQLFDECNKAFKIFKKVKADVARVESKITCGDFNEKCAEWASSGQCESNKAYMEDTCKKSCKACEEGSGSAPEPGTTLGPASMEMSKNLEELEKKLRPDQKTASTPDEVLDMVKAAVVAAQRTTEDAAAAALAQKKMKMALDRLKHDLGAEDLKKLQLKEDTGVNSPPFVSTFEFPSAEFITKERLRVTRCQRLPMTLDEVVACLAAAQKGIIYQQTVHSPEHDVGERLLAEAAMKSASELAAKRTADSDGLKPRKVASNSAYQTLEVLGVWLVFVSIFLTVLPRLFRKRMKSGRRTD